MAEEKKKEGGMSPIPTAEMNECCKVVATIKDRDFERVKAEYDAVTTELADRIIELERHAFEKGKLASSLEGEIAALKGQLHMKATAPVPVPALPKVEHTCDVCHRSCISKCTECEKYICDKQTCGQIHGHGEMYRQSK